MGSCLIIRGLCMCQEMVSEGISEPVPRLRVESKWVSFHIRASGDELSWVCVGRLDCTWSVLYRWSKSHMQWVGDFCWPAFGTDDSIASITVFCRDWCCSFRSSCFSLALDLPRSATTLEGALSSLACRSLFLSVCVEVCFSLMCLSVEE